MFVLPRITAPDVAEPLGDVGVERRDVALEDPRAGGALAALDRDQVLERDRDPEQRVERVDRAPALGAGRGEPRVGGVGLGERPSRSIVSQAFRAWFAALGARRDGPR